MATVAETAREHREAERTPGLAARVGREPGLIALVGITAIADSVYSILRNNHFSSGIDLAIFNQVVWHYSHFQAPFSTIKGEDILGDHFHPLVAILAPLYWVWSDPRMLLIAQALLVAASIVPVFLFARDRLGRGGAYLMAIAYAAFWGLQVGAGFDFHELAFAPLLIACAVLFMDRRRWGPFWVSIALLLLVKEDLSLLVVFFGVYVLTKREWRHGAALVIIGVAWFELTTRVFIPDLSAHGSYTYWSYGELGKNLPGALFALLKAPWKVFTIGLGNSEKRQTVLALFGPFLFLSIFSRLFLLAIPLLAERFLSGNPIFWSTAFQYSLAISPILAMGAADGIRNLTGWMPHQSRRVLILGAGAIVLIANVVWSASIGPANAINSLTKSSFYSTPRYAPEISAALSHVPPNASVAVTDLIAPHVSERKQIQVIGGGATMPGYVVYDTLSPFGSASGLSVTQAQLGAIINKWLTHMTPVYYNDGWLVARTEPAGVPVSNGVLTPIPPSTAKSIKAAAAAWNSSLNAANDRLFTCFVKRQPVSCYAGVPTGFEVRARAMTTAIIQAGPVLRGGCAQLAAVAVTGVQRLARDYAAMIAAAGSGSTPAFESAFTTLETYYQNDDPAGRLPRFETLCELR